MNYFKNFLISFLAINFISYLPKNMTSVIIFLIDAIFLLDHITVINVW